VQDVSTGLGIGIGIKKFIKPGTLVNADEYDIYER